MKYVNEFLKLNVNETNNKEKLLFLSIALLSEVILDRKYFGNKNDLKNFTNEILSQDYRDYLFDSRPALYARLVNDLRKSSAKDFEKFVALEKNIQTFMEVIPEISVSKLPNQDNSDLQGASKKDRKKTKSRTNPQVINDWRSVIESKE